MNREPKITSNGQGSLSKAALTELMRQAQHDLGYTKTILDDVAPSGLASDETLRSRSYVAGPQGGERLHPQREVKRL